MSGRNDDAIAADIYTRLMGLKRDIILDEDNVDNIKNQASNTISSYGDKLSRYQEEMPEIEPTMNAQERYLLAQENEHEKLLDDLNKQIDDIENSLENYRAKKEQAIDEGDQEKAQYYDTKIKKAEADISQATSSVSALAQQGYALNRKAENADNYLNKAAYRLFASPYDRLDDTICCFLRLMLRRLEVSDTDALEAMHFADEAIGDLPISELSSAIDAIRGVLYLAHTDEHQLVDDLEDMLMGIIMSPIRVFVSAILDLLREIENQAFLEAQDFFDDWVHMDAEEPDSVLDCISFEGFADFVYDQIDEFFRDIEARIMDLYNFVDEQEDILDEDSLELSRKDKIRQWYKALTEVSKYLDKIEQFSVTQSFENWAQEFLYEFDMATTYNPDTGSFEPVDLQGCISPAPKDGAYREFLPEDANDLPAYDIDEMAEFDDFLRNNISGLEEPEADSDVPLSYQSPDEHPIDHDTADDKPPADDFIDDIDSKLNGDETMTPDIDSPTDVDVPQKDAGDVQVFIDMYKPVTYDCDTFLQETKEEIKQGIDGSDALGAVNG